MSITVTVISLDFDSEFSPKTTDYSKNELTLGRGADNDIVLDLPEISDKHAKIIARLDDVTGEPKLYLTDLGSSNGTLLENAPIGADQTVALNSDQRIQIGNFLIKPVLDKDEFEKTIDIELADSNDEEVEKEVAAEDKDFEVDKLFSAKRTSGPSLDEEFLKEVGESKGKIVSLSKESEQPKQNSFIVKAKQLKEKAQEALQPEEKKEEKKVEAAAVEEKKEEKKAEEKPKAAAKAESKPSETSAEAVFSAVVESSLDNLDFVATQLFSISGIVKHNGAPLAGVEIDGGALGKATTGADGSFSFNDIEEDTAYSLSASKDEFRFEGDALSGTLSANASIELIATQLFSISGKVIHKGQPLEGVEIDAGAFGKVYTKADGSYSFNNIPEKSELKITASKDGYVFGTQTISK